MNYMVLSNVNLAVFIHVGHTLTELSGLVGSRDGLLFVVVDVCTSQGFSE